MQLLLLLSALLTSLTGAMAGARTADMQQVEASAGIAQAVAEAATAPSRQVQAEVVAQAPTFVERVPAPTITIATPQGGGRYERLLE